MEKPVTRLHWWDWPAIFLLFAILQIVTARLVATEWTEHLALVQLATSMGLAIGLALGYSQFQLKPARWISFVYMLVLLPLQWTLVIDQEASLEEQLLSVGGRRGEGLVLGVAQALQEILRASVRRLGALL